MNKTLTLAGLMLASTLMAEEKHDYAIHRYDTNDGGILWDISANGEWATIRLGSESAGGTATPKIYNVQTEEATEVKHLNSLIEVESITNDGKYVVGSRKGTPVAYNRTGRKLTSFPMRDNWEYGKLTKVTPDGKWAIGYYSGYLGVFDENGDLGGEFYFSPLMVDVAKGDTVALPGMPRLDMAHLDQHALTLIDITPDGRYVIGQMDWYIMQPNSGFIFIYDTQQHTYSVVGFTEDDRQDWKPAYPNLHHMEGGILSPNGRYLAGLAYMAVPQSGSDFFNEYGVPYRYDMQTGELHIFDEADSRNVSVGAVTDNGTIFGNPDSGSPLRNFRVLYQDKYWIPFSQICLQYYGFNFQQATGYEFTGTVMACSGDGSRIVSFPDPTGESYIFDFGCPVDQACAGIDLLRSYTVSPEADAAFSMITNVEINFGRNVQILGNGSMVHLCKADGTRVMDGLSNGGLTLKTGSRNTVVAAFRPRPLEDGVRYEVVIEAGAIAVSGDDQRVNHEIRIPYTGRTDGPMKLVKATPADHAQLRQIDNASSYILLDFDGPILTTDNCLAYLEHSSDGSRIAQMSATAGTDASTRHQLLLYPSSPIYLYAGEDYRLVIEAGSVSDYTGNASSYNQRIELTYHGTYVREVMTETQLFADDFNDPNASLGLWLRYEGDKLTPTEQMQAWGFDAENNPWNFTLHDTEESPDYFAASHSMYTRDGASDDWMMTPQLAIPADGKAVLEFDAQSFDPKCKDVLELYVYESSEVLSYLSSTRIKNIRQQAVLLDAITLTPGATQDNTAGEWTHYTYPLSEWAGQDIYIAFVNHNEGQSAIFVDNVLVQREVVCTFGFTNRDRVVCQESVVIAGQFTNMTSESQGNASLTLRDAEGNEVSRIVWTQIPAKGQPVDFAFDRPLPLAPGSEVGYTIDIRVGQKTDAYRGTIQNLAFEPVKRVVLEEMTGTTCVNCPLGIVAIEQCHRTFGDRFIPIGIHSYTGDRLSPGFEGYTAFLSLNGAPSARINRLPYVFMPMMSDGEDYQYRDMPGQGLWYDVVATELDRLAPADISLSATLHEADTRVTFDTQLRYALTTTHQQLSLLVVIVEDDVVGFQQNGFANVDSKTLSEWCGNGPYASSLVLGYHHRHVLRSVIGQTYSGTIGLFPSDLTGGQTYSATFSAAYPQSVLDRANTSAIAILIDTQTGEVINAIQSPIVVAADEASIRSVSPDGHDASVLRSLSGAVLRQQATRHDLQHLPAGIYLLGSEKVIIKP